MMMNLEPYLVPQFRPLRPFVLRPLFQLITKCSLVGFSVFTIILIATAVKFELSAMPGDNTMFMLLSDVVVMASGLFGVVLMCYFKMIYRARTAWKKAPFDYLSYQLPQFHNIVAPSHDGFFGFPPHAHAADENPSVFVNLDDHEKPN